MIEEEDEGAAATDNGGTVRRKLFATDTTPTKEINGDLRSSPSSSRNGARTPTQSNWRADETLKARDRQEERVYGDPDETDGEDEDEVYWGCLTESTVHHYENRIVEIKTGIGELDVDGLKGKVLCMRSATPCLALMEL
jgi:hypothetical protein